MSETVQKTAQSRSYAGKNLTRLMLRIAFHKLAFRRPVLLYQYQFPSWEGWREAPGWWLKCYAQTEKSFPFPFLLERCAVLTAHLSSNINPRPWRGGDKGVG